MGPAGGVYSLVRAGGGALGFKPGREFLLRFEKVLRQGELSDAHASWVHAHDLPDGFKVREVAGDEQLPVLGFIKRVAA
jgi:hypothetical protein